MMPVPTWLQAGAERSSRMRRWCLRWKANHPGKMRSAEALAAAAPLRSIGAAGLVLARCGDIYKLVQPRDRHG